VSACHWVDREEPCPNIGSTRGTWVLIFALWVTSLELYQRIYLFVKCFNGFEKIILCRGCSVKNIIQLLPAIG
jgi:hypothetical protein